MRLGLLGMLAVASAAIGQQPRCVAQKFRDLTAEYDPLSDTTLATSPFHTISAGLFSTNAADGYSLFLAAAHRGMRSDSVVVPRIYVVGTRGARSEEGLAGIAAQFSETTQLTVLVDDTVRMAWPALSHVETTSNDVIWGPRKKEYLRFTPTIEDLRRLASGKKAVVAFGTVRDNVKEKSMQRFAEVVRWADCPAARPTPRMKKS